jgi:hypothetical protein
MLWHVGLIFCGTQSIEKTMEFAIAYETDIAYFYGPIRFPWAWLPERMSVRRIFDCKLLAKNVVVGHRRL